MSGNENEPKPEWEHLAFQLHNLHPGKDPEKSWKSGYAYLIRSSISMSELYPLIGEILFGSGPSERQSSRKKNIIFFGIDDARSTLFYNIIDLEDLKDATSEDGLDHRLGQVTQASLEDPETHESFHADAPHGGQDQPTGGRNDDQYPENQKVVDHLKKTNDITNDITNSFSLLPDQAFWMDTSASFHSADDKMRLIPVGDSAETVWHERRVVGASNPMNVFRVYREMVEEKTKAYLNLFFINSLSNLHRNIGFQETTALLKTLLQDIWSPEKDSSSKEKDPSSQRKILECDSLFFAVEQEGVLAPDESHYLESFFDGIIEVKDLGLPSYRLPLVTISALPGHVQLPEPFVYFSNHLKEGKDFSKMENLEKINEILKKAKIGNLKIGKYSCGKGVFINAYPFNKKPPIDREKSGCGS